MSNVKTLLGPGYYNVNHSNTERSCPSFQFEPDPTLNFNPEKIAFYVKEIQQIRRNREERLRESLNMLLQREALNQYSSDPRKRTKDQVMHEMIRTMHKEGKIESEDAKMFIEKVIEQANHSKTPLAAADEKTSEQPPAAAAVL